MAMIDQLKPLLGKFTKFAQNKMGFDRPPRLFLKQDMNNAKVPLGRTAHYDPANKAVTIFMTGRHPKDILRSFAHELVHHTQNLRGDLSPEKCGDMGDKYAQENPHMRKMEEEAYLVGNMCFRDWEDNEKFTMQESKMLKENKQMTTKMTKESLKNMIQKILMERMQDETEQTNEDNAFAPNHYCVHHGGVQHEGKIVHAEAVNHNWNEKLQKVTAYDMKLPDGTILENVSADDILVTNASLAEGHHSHSSKRDEDEDVSEDIGDDALAATRKAKADLRATDAMAQDAVVKSRTPASAKKKMPPAPKVNPKAAKYDDDLYMKEEEDIEEGAKPDYIDIDGDGNTDESMKEAAKDKKGMNTGGVVRGKARGMGAAKKGGGYNVSPN